LKDFHLPVIAFIDLFSVGFELREAASEILNNTSREHRLFEIGFIEGIADEGLQNLQKSFVQNLFIANIFAIDLLDNFPFLVENDFRLLNSF